MTDSQQKSNTAVVWLPHAYLKHHQANYLHIKALVLLKGWYLLEQDESESGKEQSATKPQAGSYYGHEAFGRRWGNKSKRAIGNVLQELYCRRLLVDKVGNPILDAAGVPQLEPLKEGETRLEWIILRKGAPQQPSTIYFKPAPGVGRDKHDQSGVAYGNGNHAGAVAVPLALASDERLHRTYDATTAIYAVIAMLGQLGKEESLTHTKIGSYVGLQADAVLINLHKMRDLGYLTWWWRSITESCVFYLPSEEASGKREQVELEMDSYYDQQVAAAAKQGLTIRRPARWAIRMEQEAARQERRAQTAARRKEQEANHANFEQGITNTNLANYLIEQANAVAAGGQDSPIAKAGSRHRSQMELALTLSRWQDERLTPEGHFNPTPEGHSPTPIQSFNRQPEGQSNPTPEGHPDQFPAAQVAEGHFNPTPEGHSPTPIQSFNRQPESHSNPTLEGHPDQFPAEQVTEGHSNPTLEGHPDQFPAEQLTEGQSNPTPEGHPDQFPTAQLTEGHFNPTPEGHSDRRIKTLDSDSDSEESTPMREGETEGRQITAALDQLTDRLNEDEDWAVPVSKRESHRRAVRQLYRDHQKDIPLPRFISLFNEASCIAGDKAASEIETTRWAYFVGTLKQRLSGAATTLPASPLPRTQYTRPASRRPRGEDGYRPPMQIASQQPTFDQQPTSPAQAVDKEAAARRLLLSYGVDQETLELWLKARLRLQEEEPTGFTACFKDAFLARPQPNVALIVLPRRVPVEAAETYEGDLRRALGPLYQVRDLVIKFEQVKVNPALV